MFGLPPPLPVDLAPVAPSAPVTIGRGGVVPIGAIARGGPLTVWSLRLPGGDVAVAQETLAAAGADRTEIARTPSATLGDAMPPILRIRVRSGSTQILESHLGPCDTSVRVRVDTNASAAQSFLIDCGGPLVRTVAAGLDAGWVAYVGVTTLPIGETPQPSDGRLAPGKYRVEVVANPSGLYRETDTTNDTTTFDLTVTDSEADPAVRELPPASPDSHPSLGAPTARAIRRIVALAREQGRHPRTLPASVIPNLRTTPPAGMHIAKPADGKQWLRFNAIVVNAGPGRVEVNARRRLGTKATQAYQVFRRGSRIVAARRAGRLVWDPRDGHKHWHFDRLATYRLLDAKGRVLRVSTKVGFCFIDSTPIDFDAAGAVMHPFVITQPTNCGTLVDRNLRMTIDSGYGDEYLQYLPGQAFDVTNLPNGAYTIEVIANPKRLLRERNYRDNRARRLIELSGEGGNRTVTAELVDGVDTETWYDEQRALGFRLVQAGQPVWLRFAPSTLRAIGL